MLGHRRQYRILGVAVVFALVGIAFFGAYHGARHWESTQPRGISIEIGKKGHPRFLSVDYLIEDPAVFVNLCVMMITGGVLVVTLITSRKALKASTQVTETLIATERPYVTGGGGFDYRIGNFILHPAMMVNVPAGGKRVLGLNVANYGKTPALLTHYDVRFKTIGEVMTGPTKVTKENPHYDWLATGHENAKIIAEIDIPDEKDVVFGCFWYLDSQKKEHYFRFILRIGDTTTHSTIADEVDKSYTDWT